MGRAPCCDKANVKRGPWSPEEDARLKTYIEEHGTGGNWIALPHKIGLKRCGKSCRLRWLNYLRPNIKHGGFSEEEDSLICNLYISIGSRWSVIAAQLPGRTDNDIKNYWNTRLKKKLLGRRKDSQSRRGLLSSNQEQAKVKKDAMDSAGNTTSQSLSASAVERMQLYIQLQGLNTPLSFYNNPAIWPKFVHPLGDHGILQTQQSQEQLATDPQLQQLPLQTTTPEPSPDMSLPSNQINGKVSNTGEFDVYSLNGFSSESSSAIFTNGEMNENFGSAAAGLQEELSELFYGENTGNLEEAQGFQQQQQQQQEKLIINQDLDCVREIESPDYDNMISWWTNNGVSQKSSSSSWESNPVDLHTESIFQDFNWGMSYI